MFTRSDSSLRRRVALAVGAGAFVLAAGAGGAYAAGSSDVVEAGWATVVDNDQTSATGEYRAAESGNASRSSAVRDCPGYESGAGSGGAESSPSTDGSPQTSPDQGSTPEDRAGDL